MDPLGSALLGLLGGAASATAVVTLLGRVWADRILESQKAANLREHELIVRRRDVYLKLILGMRVFIDAEPEQEDARREKWARFLAAYDEAALWAPDDVLNPVNAFLARWRENQKGAAPASREEFRQLLSACVTAMRKDVGFTATTFQYRFLSY